MEDFAVRMALMNNIHGGSPLNIHQREARSRSSLLGSSGSELIENVDHRNVNLKGEKSRGERMPEEKCKKEISPEHHPELKNDGDSSQMQLATPVCSTVQFVPQALVLANSIRIFLICLND